jgi:hypothetical protein
VEPQSGEAAPAGTGAPASPSGAATSSPGGSTRTAAVKGHSGSTSLQASEVEPEGMSPLIGWGIGLVALSAGAGVAVVRMRRS